MSHELRSNPTSARAMGKNENYTMLLPEGVDLVPEMVVASAVVNM